VVTIALAGDGVRPGSVPRLSPKRAGEGGNP